MPPPGFRTMPARMAFAKAESVPGARPPILAVRPRQRPCGPRFRWRAPLRIYASPLYFVKIAEERKAAYRPFPPSTWPAIAKRRPAPGKESLLPRLRAVTIPHCRAFSALGATRIRMQRAIVTRIRSVRPGTTRATRPTLIQTPTRPPAGTTPARPPAGTAAARSGPACARSSLCIIQTQQQRAGVGQPGSHKTQQETPTAGCRPFRRIASTLFHFMLAHDSLQYHATL